MEPGEEYAYNQLVLPYKNHTKDILIDLWRKTTRIRMNNIYKNESLTSVDILKQLKYLKEPYAFELVNNFGIYNIYI
jgi:hypothetical protein